MRILPVLDLLGGIVVRGIAGRRHEYKSLQSPLVASPNPLVVAEAFRKHFDLTELYLADLDAIAGANPDLPTYATLQHARFRLWVDAGIDRLPQAKAIADIGIHSIVVGLETLAGPDELSEIVGDLGRRIVFSLDLKGETPMGNLSAWRARDAWSIANQAVELGISRLLILDLARVGVNEGTGTEGLCRQLAATFPQIELTAGGGVRGKDDLNRLQSCGVSNVLVASALHDGRLTKADVNR